MAYQDEIGHLLQVYFSGVITPEGAIPVGLLAGGKGRTSITFGEVAERYAFR